MTATAKLSYLNIAPRKVRLVARLIKGKTVKDAQSVLRFTFKRSAEPILKLLNSAIANAKNNLHLEESNLYIAKINVDEGPKRKKWRARARGSAGKIQRKTSHVSLFLAEIANQEKRKKSKVVKEDAQVQSGTDKTERTPKTKKQKFQLKFKEAQPKIKKEARKMFRRKAF